MRVTVFAAIAAALAFPGSALAHHGPGSHGHHGGNDVKRIVVIYEENHSFDNLYGGWEGVNGLANAGKHATQVDQAGAPYACLKQDDVNLTTPPLGASCAPDSDFANSPFKIDDFIAPTDTTCPPPGAFMANGFLKGTGLPGGCTRDLVHRFYQEQYQLDGGKQDRYVTGSDAIGLTMGYYDTKALPIYNYLHAPGHPAYAIADRLLPGRLRWLVPQPPVARRRGDAGLPGRNARPALGARRQRDADELPALHRDRRRQRHGGDAGVPGDATAWPVATTPSTRSSRPTSRSRRAPRSSSRRRRARRSAIASARSTSTGRGTRAAGRTPTATSTHRAGRTAPGRRARIRTRLRARRSPIARTSCSSSTTSP